MPGSLGAKIGEGATADVHAWAPGRVVKLLKAGLPQRLIAHEARLTRAVFSSGAPAPEVFDHVSVEGRFGVVMSHLEGPTLMQLTKSGAVTYAEAGAVLAGLLQAVHKIRPPPDAPMLRDYMAESVARVGAKLPKHIAAGVLETMNRLSPGDGLCHGDPNPGNVIMTAEGPRLIDWIGAMRAPPALDLASAHVLLSELAPEIADDPERPRAVHASLHTAYAGLTGMSPAALAKTVEPYLPVVRMLVLLGGAVPALCTHLIRSLEAHFPA
jgi:aminoglycoside phosphotransferase (APT) family kinase protein